MLSLCLEGTAFGQDSPSSAKLFALRSALKSSALLTRAAEAIPPGADRDTATGFWRMRIEPTIRWPNGVSFDVAFEQRLKVSSSLPALVGGEVLPASAAAPFRVRQLDWEFASGSRAEWRGEIDRAELHVHAARTDLTIGRQAIGWGRGALFGAVDLFAPFSPLEADREWRRGVDAVRADVRLSDRSSLDSVAAFGETATESTFASRLRGYAGKADVEVVGGYRARDLFAGLTSSAAVGAFEFHGELAMFRTPASPGSEAFRDRRLIAKGVAGGSYRVPAGHGVLVYGEYHYSGLGAVSADQLVANLRDREFQMRYLRGDTQILGRHAAAVLASYELSPELAVSSQWIHNPSDASGVVVPSITWTISDRWSALLSAYVPYGRETSEGTPGSEYGASPVAAFLQLRSYW